jgi:GT2 family glycosyltransferase
MAIAVVIINWNDAAATMTCVRSVKQWTALQPRVWVVDNNSSDGSAELIARECPDVHLIRNEVNCGFGGGNNLGLVAALEAGCDEVLLLNNDASIDEENLARLSGALRQNERLGIVGPVLRERSTGALLAAGGRDISRHIVSHMRPARIEPAVYEVSYVPGTVALVRSDVLRAVGLFDEAYFFSGEMADLCERAWRHGYICAINGRVTAFHDLQHSAQLRQALHLYYILRNRFLFVRKFRSQQKLPLFAFWLVYGLAFTGAALLRGQRGQARAMGLALADGLRGQFGGQNDRVLRAGEASGR